MWLPSAMQMSGRPGDMGAAFASVEGASLHWWFHSATMSQLGVVAFMPEGRMAEIGFWSLDYIDLAAQMHAARIQPASPAEIQILRDRANRDGGWVQLTRGGVIAIHSREGLFFVCCREVGLRWVTAVDTEPLREVAGGYGLAELDLRALCG